MKRKSDSALIDEFDTQKKDLKLQEPPKTVIGIIGGLDWPSTLEYYRQIHQEYDRKYKGEGKSRIIIISVDCAKEYNGGDVAGYFPVLLDAGKKLKMCEADFYLIACNTAHLNAPRLVKQLDLPFLHISDATAFFIKEKGIKKVGLLGTKFTMTEKEILMNRFLKHGIEAIAPEKEETRQGVHDSIPEITYSTKEENKKAFITAIKELVEAGATGIVLGCTEIGILIKESDVTGVHSSLGYFDTALCHALAASQIQLGTKKLEDFLPPSS